MNKDFDLIAEFREDQGKGASRRLRRLGKVPAIIYGGGREPRSLTFDHDKVTQQLANERFYSSVLNIKVGDQSQAAILKDVQRHPAKPQIMHLDLQRVVEDEEIRVYVPIHYIGETVAIGVKQGGGTVTKLMTDIEVACLPKDLPEYLEVDISQLDLNDMLYMSDIKAPGGVEIVGLTHGDKLDHPIVSIQIIKEEVIEEEAPEELVVPVEGEEVEEPEEAAGADKEAEADSDDD